MLRVAKIEREIVIRRVLPSVRYLQECFTYNFDTGELHWKRRPEWHFVSHDVSVRWNTKYSDKIAGTVTSYGYVNILVDHTSYRAHRIIYKIVTGEEPPAFLDHENTIRFANQWNNIRIVTRSQNGANRKINSNSTTGFKGVVLRGDRFRVRISVNGKRQTIGNYDSAEEAHTAYCVAARKLHGEFANSGRR